MKISFRLIFFVFLLPCTISAGESLHGITGGIRYSIPSFNGFGIYENSKDKPHLGFSLGYGYWYRFNSNFSFRTGLKMTNKSLEFENTNGSLELKYLILNAPALLQYNLSEQFAFFSGFNVVYTAFDNCKSQVKWVCEATKDTFTILLGGQMRLHENGYFDLFYEKTLFKLGKYEEHINDILVSGYDMDYSVIGLSYIYFFK